MTVGLYVDARNGPVAGDGMSAYRLYCAQEGADLFVIR